MSEELKEEWYIWRLVTNKIASLHEIDSYWSYNDIMKANAAMDVKNDYERWGNYILNKDIKSK